MNREGDERRFCFFQATRGGSLRFNLHVSNLDDLFLLWNRIRLRLLFRLHKPIGCLLEDRTLLLSDGLVQPGNFECSSFSLEEQLARSLPIRDECG